MNERKIVIFGAGKIGRSFIGQVFNLSGYEVVFVDINKQLVDLINQQKQYRIVIKNGEEDELLIIRNIKGIYLDEEEQLMSELNNTKIMSLSVGQQGVGTVIPLLARSLVIRREKYGDVPLDIIIAENIRNADRLIRKELEKQLPPDYPLEKLVGLVETSIGKMVPIMTQKDIEEDPLQVFAESYNSLIVAKNGFKTQFPIFLFWRPKRISKPGSTANFLSTI